MTYTDASMLIRTPLLEASGRDSEDTQLIVHHHHQHHHLQRSVVAMLSDTEEPCKSFSFCWRMAVTIIEEIPKCKFTLISTAPSNMFVLGNESPIFRVFACVGILELLTHAVWLHEFWHPSDGQCRSALQSPI